MRGSVLGAGLVVAGWLFLGRLTGFLREVFLADRLGLGAGADLAVFTLTLPDVFTNLLVGGAFGAALIPEFKKHLAVSPPRAAALFRQASLISFLIFSGLAGLVCSGTPFVVRILAPGIVDLDVAARMVLGVAATIPLTAAAAVTTAYLQAHDRFGVAAAGTFLFNAVLIGALILGVGPQGILPLAVGASVAALLRWVSQLVATPRSVPPADAPARSEWLLTKKILRRYLEALGSMGLLLLVPVTIRSLASAEGTGELAGVNYVLRLQELPLGLALTVLSVVLLPRFSRMSSEGKLQEIAVLARQGTWLTWAMSLPMTFVLSWYALPIIQLLFGRGNLTEDQAGSLARLTPWAMAALPAQGVGSVLFALLMARGDTRAPLRIALVAFVLFVGAAAVVRQPFGREGLLAANSALHWGIALAYVVRILRKHSIPLFGDGLGRDLVAAAGAAIAGFLPAALLLPAGAGAVWGTLASAGAGAASGLAVLAVRTRSFEGGAIGLLKTLARGM